MAVAIRAALEDLRRPRIVDASQEAALKGEMRDLEQEISNLTATVRAAGPLPSLVAALQAAEQRKGEILRTLKPPRAVPADAGRLQALLGEWREMFRANVGVA